MRNYCGSLSDEKSRLRGRIQAYTELGMHKEAVEESRRLVRLDLHDSSAFIELGCSCEENNEVNKAIRYYRYAIRKFPRDSRLYANLGYCYGKYKKRNDLERYYCEWALGLDPFNEWALNNIGAVAERKGRREESLAYYEKAHDACLCKYGFVCTHILHNFAWALYRSRKYMRSWLFYSYLVGECAEDPNVLCDFGRVNYKIGAYGNALEYFSKALLCNPDSRHYRRLCGMARKKAVAQHGKIGTILK